MSALFSGRAYSHYGWPLGWLKLVSVDGGKVANGVADMEVTALGPFAAWWRDIGHIDVWRYSGLGLTNRWECYKVRGWTEKYENGRTVYAFKGKSLAQEMAARPASDVTSSSSKAATFADHALSIISSSVAAWPTGLTVVYQAIDGPSDTVTVKQTNQMALAALQNLVTISKTASTTGWFNFAVNPVIRADGTLAMGLVTWAGEYGADRRVDTGQKPFVVWLKGVVDKYDAVRDESGIITVVNLASSTVTNDTLLNNPYGNYWAANDSSSGTDATTNAQATLWKNRGATRLALDLSVDVDAMPLGLGDVVSVVYGGAYVDGRVNVIHTTWNDAGERLVARIDVGI